MNIISNLKFRSKTALFSASVSPFKKKLISDGAWAFLGKMLALFSGLIISTLLSRLLTPEELGAYYLTLSLTSVAVIVAQFGLNRTIVRLIAESLGTGRPGRALKSIRLAIEITIVSTGIVAGFLAFGLGKWIATNLFHSDLMAQVVRIAVIWMVMTAFQSLIGEIFRGLSNIRMAAIFGRLSTTLLSMFLFAGLWIIHGHSNINEIILLSIISGLFSIIISSLILRNNLRDFPFEDSISIKDVVSISGVIWITNIFLLIWSQSDVWILGAFRSQEDVALYSLAFKLVVLVNIPSIVVNAIIPPIIAETYSQKNLHKLERVLRTAATSAALPSVLIFLVLIFRGDFILGTLYGEYYKAARFILAILSIGPLINVLSGSCGETLLLTGFQETMLKITIFGAFFTVLGELLLVQTHGAIGVAMAAMTGMSLQNLLTLFVTRKKVGVWTFANFGFLRNFISA